MKPTSDSRRALTIPDFVRAKQDGQRISMLTAYDALWAGIFEAAGIDSLLVGDSLGMVVQGRDTTLPVTLDEIIYHTQLVCRGAPRTLVIADLPFMSYQISPQQAVASAGRILKETGAAAVKLEGGRNQAETIAALARVDIPVMAHVGMRPQSIRKLGKHSAIQRDAKELLLDAQAAEQAGAFSVLLELVPRGVAQEITAALTVPTIGIGAGAGCDGQVLVSPDMLGLTGFKPKFVKQFAELRSTIIQAVQAYATEVHSGEFPDRNNSHE